MESGTCAERWSRWDKFRASLVIQRKISEKGVKRYIINNTRSDSTRILAVFFIRDSRFSGKPVFEATLATAIQVYL